MTSPFSETNYLFSSPLRGCLSPKDTGRSYSCRGRLAFVLSTELFFPRCPPSWFGECTGFYGNYLCYTLISTYTSLPSDTSRALFQAWDAGLHQQCLSHLRIICQKSFPNSSFPAHLILRCHINSFRHCDAKLPFISPQ